jgi:CheY-like chemotaxis protein|tara:strand:- start:122 stop:307 length:186 start_codon:yes stop_codon:yes gene_type:complete
MMMTRAIMMPEMDDWVVLETVKKNEKLMDMSVLISTAKPTSPNKPFIKSEPLEFLYALVIE